MRKIQKRKGSAYLLVVIVFLVLSLFTTLMVTSLNQSIFQMHTYALQMKAYYLNHEAEEAVVAILLDNSNDLLEHLAYPQTDSMEHTDGSEVIGESVITLTKEVHSYYGTDEDWVVARVETTIPDVRGDRIGEPFTYTGSVMILLSNPIVQLYNISPESL